MDYILQFQQKHRMQMDYGVLALVQQKPKEDPH